MTTATEIKKEAPERPATMQAKGDMPPELGGSLPFETKPTSEVTESVEDGSEGAEILKLLEKTSPEMLQEPGMVASEPETQGPPVVVQAPTAPAPAAAPTLPDALTPSTTYLLTELLLRETL